MAARALNAASGTLVVLRMLNVSACSGEVIVPLIVGWMANPNLNAAFPENRSR